MVNTTGKSETLCWTCANALKRCSWSRNFSPVEGWDAIPTKIRMDRGIAIDSFFVRDCPLYNPDRIE